MRLEEHQTFSNAPQTAFVAGALHGWTYQFRTLGAMEDQTHLTNKEQQGTAILQTIHDLENAKVRAAGLASLCDREMFRMHKGQSL
jgi:hypothetical protein